MYTSADSVFQIAAHEDVVPLETLYAWCQAAREILQGEYAVARVIARPFRGQHPFERANEHRKDYSLTPPPTVLDALKEAGKDVVGIGKIPDIYAGQGFTESIHTDDNADGIRKTLERMKRGVDGLIFTNLVDTDAKFGHRRDPAGYSNALAEFDRALPEILAAAGKRHPADSLRPRQRPDLARHRPHPRIRPAAGLSPRPGCAGFGRTRNLCRRGCNGSGSAGAAWNGPGTSFWNDLQ